MTNITLRQLKYFEALARELHFGRAASACAVTQPALSMQIQEMEQQLGVALVERTHAGVRLTDSGGHIAERAKRILAGVRDLAEFARHSGGLLTGSLRLGVIPSMAPYLLPSLLTLVRKRYPELELIVRETQTLPLTRELADGKLDVLLLALPIVHPDFTTLPLYEDRFQLALPAARKLSSRVRVTPDLVAQERLLLLEEGHCLRDQALAYCKLRQVDHLDTFGASSLSTIVEMVAAGLGLTLLPEMCIGVESRGRPIRLMRFVAPEPSRTVGLAWRTTSPRRADFEEFGRLVLEAAGKTAP
jgi:LysR family hydrogen peroxide-inducible transcriptional activator